MNIAALVESEDHVCCRYRLRAFQSQLEAAGHRMTICELSKNLSSRFRFYSTLKIFDAVILQRRQLSYFDLFWLRHYSKTLVFDFDDALWLRDSYSGRGFESSKRGRRFRNIVLKCDVVVAGNSILAEEASKYSKSVSIIPTCVDAAKYPLSTHTNDPPQLVWVGSSSTLQGLERNRELFESLGKAIPGLRLKVICDRFPKFVNIVVEPVIWDEATEAREIAGADIGIGWVPDDPWSRGKCGLKLLQYQAAGLAVVANPVGVQSEIVRDGETGFLATTHSEWVETIRKLVADVELRKRLGSAARERVEKEYSVEVGAAKWLELLDRLFPSKKPSPPAPLP